jgi:basic amino acid/polyamine antiporter, APA family
MRARNYDTGGGAAGELCRNRRPLFDMPCEMSSPHSARPETRLIRGIGRWALAAFAINLTVGAGILGLQGRIQALVGNYSIAVLVACGVLMGLMALCFAEIGSRFDRTGGPQLYASIAMGPTAGFTVGWLLWISRVGSCAVVANLLVDYGLVLWSPLSTPLARAIAITALALGYMWINLRGIRQTAAVSTTFTLCKLLPLVAFALVGVFFIDPLAYDLGPLPPVGDVSTAVLLAAYAFFGFDATPVLAGEVRDPARSVPFAIVVSMGTVLVLYTAIQVVCVGTLPGLAESQRPLADAAVSFVGPSGAMAIALTAVVACAGVYGASFTPGTRLLFAMSERGQLPATFGDLHARYRTPVMTIVATTVVVLVLALSGSFIYLVKVTLIARLSVYAITCALLPVFRRRHDVPKASFVLPAGSFIGCFTAACCLLFLVNSSMREMLDVGIAVLCGLILFALTRHTRRTVVATPSL